MLGQLDLVRLSRYPVIRFRQVVQSGLNFAFDLPIDRSFEVAVGWLLLRPAPHVFDLAGDGLSLNLSVTSLVELLSHSD